MPNLRTQKCFDLLKFVSVMVYQATLFLFVAYYTTRQFSNIYLKELFYLFLTIRPIVIVSYTTFTAMCNCKAAFYITRSLRKEKVNLATLKK